MLSKGPVLPTDKQEPCQDGRALMLPGMTSNRPPAPRLLDGNVGTQKEAWPLSFYP